MPGPQVLDVDVTLGEARGEHARRAATGNLDFRARAFAATHGKHHGAAVHVDHTRFGHDADGVPGGAHEFACIGLCVGHV